MEARRVHLAVHLPDEVTHNFTLDRDKGERYTLTVGGAVLLVYPNGGKSYVGYPTATIERYNVTDLEAEVPERTPFLVSPTMIEDLAKTTAGDEGWRCLCGNIAETDGFHPWNNGYVEPTEADWPDPLYVCDRCGRIILDAGDVGPWIVGRVELEDHRGTRP